MLLPCKCKACVTGTLSFFLEYLLKVEEFKKEVYGNHESQALHIENV